LKVHEKNLVTKFLIIFIYSVVAALISENKFVMVESKQNFKLALKE